MRRLGFFVSRGGAYESQTVYPSCGNRLPGPADKAGLRGSSGTKQIDVFSVPVGGDVVIKADGQSVTDFDDLLSIVASKNPGAVLMLTILRDGKQQEIAVTLEVRP